MNAETEIIDGQEEQATDEGQEQELKDPSEEWPENDPLKDHPELQEELWKLYQKVVGEDRYSRLVEVKDVKQAEMYWRGLQYIWWSEQDQSWNLPSQAQAINNADLNIDDMPKFEFVTNIYQGYGLTIVAAVSQAVPRVRFFPEDADDADDIETADRYTKISSQIERWNPVKRRLQEESYHLYTGGFVLEYTRYLADGERFGYEPVEDLQLEDAQFGEATLDCSNCGFSVATNRMMPPVPCPQCGVELTDANINLHDVPSATGMGEEDVPKGRQVISLWGALNCRRPQWAKQQSDWHYLGIETEVHYAKLRAAFPYVADRIQPGAGAGEDDAFERNARLSVAEGTKLLTQSGGALASLVTFARVWFRPTAFWILPKDVRARFKATVPDFMRVGCRVEFAGDTYCQSAAESMDKHIASCHAFPGEGQNRNGIGTSMISVQDRINTFTNIQAETYEYGLPITYRASDTFSSEANADQRSEPGSEVEVPLRPGEKIGDRIMQVRADQASADMIEHVKDLRGETSQFMTGAFPALMGANTEGAAGDTASGYAMQRDQAMGRAGVFYSNLVQLHADIMTLSCRDLCEKSSGQLKITSLNDGGDFEAETVDVTALEGDATAYPEGDENFPEMWNQRRAMFMKVMESPFGPELIKEPDNADLATKMTGLTELVIPGASARRKQLREIGILTKVPPGMDGSPVIDIPVDPETEDHPNEGLTCKNWLNDQKGMKVKEKNPQGWMNVKIHMLKHNALIPPPQPEQKPVSKSINYKDLTPDGQIQLGAEAGLKLNPELVGIKAVVDHMSKIPLASGSEGAPGDKPGKPNPTSKGDK